MEVGEQEPGIDQESTIITNDKTFLSVLGHLLISRSYRMYGITITLIQVP